MRESERKESRVGVWVAHVRRIVVHVRHSVICREHESMRCFEGGEMFLRCGTCLLRSPGWFVGPPVRESLLE